MIDTFLIEFQGFKVEQVADMLAHKGGFSPCQAEGGFQSASTAENRRQFAVQKNGVGHIASGPPEHHGAFSHHSGHRVIDTGDDITIMEKECIGDPVEFVKSALITGTDRFSGNIAAGHHQYLWTVLMLKEKVVEGGVGQHDPDFTNTWSQVGSHHISLFLFQ